MIPDLVSTMIEFEAGAPSRADGLAGELAEKLPEVMAKFEAWRPAAPADQLVTAVTALAALYKKLGRHQDLADFADAALRPKGGEGMDPLLQGAYLAAQGKALLFLDQPKECFRKLTQAQLAFARAKREDLEEKVLADFVEYAQRYGKAAEVIAPFRLRLDECRAKGDKKGQAAAMLDLGRLEEMRGHLLEMRDWLDASLLLFRELGLKRGAQDCLDRLADRALREGDYVRAQKHSQDFLNLAQDSVDRSGLVWSELRLAELELFTGQLDHALGRLKKSLALISPQRERWTWAYFTNKIGEAQRIAGRLEDAAKNSRASLEAFTALGDAWGKAWAADFLGYALWRAGQRGEGLALLENAARQHEKQGDKASLGGCLTRLGELLLVDKGPAAAWPELKKAMAFCLENAYASSQSECLAVAAACFQAEGRALSGELALFLGANQGSTFSCKETLKRLALKPGPRLVMLAERPSRHVDLTVAMQLVMTVATSH